MKFFCTNLYFVQQQKRKNLDPKYYAILGVILKLIEQDENIYKNISISPLWQSDDKYYYIKICLYDENIFNSFMKIIKTKIDNIIEIDAIPFKLIMVSNPNDQDIFDIDKELEKNLNTNYSNIKLNFISPTVVKATPYYKLFPESDVYLYSLIKKHENILGEDLFFKTYGFKTTPKIKSLLEDGILISNYKLEIEKIFIKGGHIPGNLGWVKYSINKHFDDAVFDVLKSTLPIFIKGSKRTGLGYGTRLGFGQIIGEIL